VALGSVVRGGLTIEDDVEPALCCTDGTEAQAGVERIAGFRHGGDQQMDGLAP
jgi:hypothetical protein